MCSRMSRAARTHVSGYYYWTEQSAETFGNTLALLLRLHAMRAYEDQSINQYGMVSLFSGFVDFLDHPNTHIFANVFNQGIQLTRFWTSCKESHITVRFLKAAIADGDAQIVKLLLENSVSVHQRIDKTSPLEFACDSVMALDL